MALTHRTHTRLHTRLSALKRRLKGDLSLSDNDLLLYSTDASIYQQRPIAIARPADRDDCLKILQFAREHQIALIPRAGGTSLAGQVVGEAIIVDVSRYMTDIISVNREAQTALVQPGVVLESLNQRVNPLGLKFAPDPSTLNRCTVSGVIGNNAWGAHAPAYGSTRDHVLETELALPNGDLIRTAPLDGPAFSRKQSLPGKEGEIYRCVEFILREHRALIAERYPNRREVICNAGYALHELAAMRPWSPQGPEFNLSALVCGSEGTLGLITQARLKLVRLPRHSVMIAAHFHLLDEALHSVAPALRQGACAVELLDEVLLDLTAKNPQQAKNRFWIKGKPNAVLLIEFYGENLRDINDRIQQLTDEYRSLGLGYAHAIIEAGETPPVWAMRRAALGLLMGATGAKKAVSFIEDSAVPVRHLPAFVGEVRALMRQYALPCVYYGSVSMGLIHLRPMLDLNQHQDRQAFKTLADEVAKLLMHFNGTMSAKHGDGIVRSPYIKQFFGETLNHCLQTVKTCFDPDNVLNPRKIVNPGPIDANLRYQPAALAGLRAGFSWRPDGLYAAAEQCNGAGACRKPAGNGTMCPSYMATLEELHCTRGRANTIRQALQRQRGFDKEALSVINRSLEFCLSCKGCRSECPANVDMARLKAECAYQTNLISGPGLRARLFERLDTLSRIASLAPAAGNALFGQPMLKRMLGFSPRRRLPRLAARRLSDWFRARAEHKNAGAAGRVILLNDLFSEYYEPAPGRSAVQMLERWGFKVELSPCFPSARLCVSLGLLPQARARITAALQWLRSRVTEDACIIGLEPSELLTYRDEAGALLTEDSQLRFLQDHQNRFVLFEEFVCEHAPALKPVAFREDPMRVAVHVHCHQKSLSDAEKCPRSLRLIPGVGIQSIASGCCGMAGLFGYAEKNYELSRQIGELVLFPAIRELPDAARIVATGASCRQQIRDGAQREALHVARVLEQALVNN